MIKKQAKDIQIKIARLDLADEFEQGINFLIELIPVLQQLNEEDIKRQAQDKVVSYISLLNHEVSSTQDCQILLSIRDRLSQITRLKYYLSGPQLERLERIIAQINKKCLGSEYDNLTPDEKNKLAEIEYLLGIIGFNINHPRFNELLNLLASQEEKDTFVTDEFQRLFNEKKQLFLKRMNQYLEEALKSEETSNLRICEDLIKLLIKSFGNDCLSISITPLLENKKNKIDTEAKIKELNTCYFQGDLVSFKDWYAINSDFNHHAEGNAKEQIKILRALLDVIEDILEMFRRERYNDTINQLLNFTGSEQFQNLSSALKQGFFKCLESESRSGV